MYGSEQFAAQLLAAGAAILPFVFAGAAAGVVVLTLWLGLRTGIRALHTVASGGASEFTGWGESAVDRYDAEVSEYMAGGWSYEEAASIAGISQDKEFNDYVDDDSNFTDEKWGKF